MDVPHKHLENLTWKPARPHAKEHKDRRYSDLLLGQLTSVYTSQTGPMILTNPASYHLIAIELTDSVVVTAAVPRNVTTGLYILTYILRQHNIHSPQQQTKAPTWRRPSISASSAAWSTASASCFMPREQAFKAQHSWSLGFRASILRVESNQRAVVKAS